MNEKIDSLIRLQNMDTQLDRQNQSHRQIAPQRDKIKADIQALLTRLEERKKSLTEAQVGRKSLELDIESKEQAMRKSASELNSVKSNDAYKVLLTQIEDARKSKAEIEDNVLELMEKIDQTQKDVKEAEKRIQTEKADFEKQLMDLDAKEKSLLDEIQQKKNERDQYFQSLPEPVRYPYERVQRGRPNFAVMVSINENNCGGCRTTLPPSVINEVMKGKDLVSCETCSRILYIPPDVPAKT